jgi:hypothetical protein
MSIELLAGLKGVRAPPGMGSKIGNFFRRRITLNIQVVGPAGSGVTSYILQLIQRGILDTEVMKTYNEGKPFTTTVQIGGTPRKLGLRDIPIDDEEDRFTLMCADYMKRKPMGVVWVAPGRPKILKEKDEREEYALFRRYVQFLVSDTYPMPGKDVKTVKPKFLMVVINHMDEYDAMWQVTFFTFLHYYRKPLSYIRKKHKDVRVICIPSCAWAGINVLDPLIDIITSVLYEG